MADCDLCGGGFGCVGRVSAEGGCVGGRWIRGMTGGDNLITALSLLSSSSQHSQHFTCFFVFCYFFFFWGGGCWGVFFLTYIFIAMVTEKPAEESSNRTANEKKASTPNFQQQINQRINIQTKHVNETSRSPDPGFNCQG